MELFSTFRREVELTFDWNPFLDAPKCYFATHFFKRVKFWQGVCTPDSHRLIRKRKRDGECETRRLPDGNCNSGYWIITNGHCKRGSVPRSAVAVDGCREGPGTLQIFR